MIYHVLPELEPLSAREGGALAHTVANLMCLDDQRLAVCPGSDDSWGFTRDRVLVIPGLRAYAATRGKRFVPRQIKDFALRTIYQPLLSRLQEGDIVWCHNRPAYAAALAHRVRQAGARIICHFHDGNDEQLVKASFQHFQPDASIFVSEYLRRFWLSRLGGLTNTHVVFNGADENAFNPNSASAAGNQIPVVLYVGRLHPEKGPHVLLEAMRILQDRRVHAKCRIIGSSYSGGSKPTPYVNHLHESSPTNVEFEGFWPANNIGELYRSADILCCPSIWQEPFGKVNIEALASGIPVVASRVGGIPEISAHGGVVMVTPEAPIELADALQELIEKKSLRDDLGAKGRQSFRHNFTWRVALKHYQTITDALLEPVGSHL